GAAMKDPVARFWAVEHITSMMLAVILAHVGRVLGRKAATPDSRRMKLFICFGIATVLMLLAIPWPGMSAGRPLFRFCSLHHDATHAAKPVLGRTMNSDELVTVSTFPSAVDAEIAKGVLDDAGIESM